MSGGFYGEMQDVATELLTEFQQGTVVLVRNTEVPVEVDESRPWDVERNPEEDQPERVTLQAAVRTIESKYLKNERLRATDLQITFAVPSVTPLETDQFEVDGVLCTTVGSRTLPAAGTPVAYIFFVRR